MKSKLYKMLSIVLAVAILLPTANATFYPAGESLNYSYDFDFRPELSGAIGDMLQIIEEGISFDFYSGNTYINTVYSTSGNFSCNYYITNAIMNIDLSSYDFVIFSPAGQKIVSIKNTKTFPFSSSYSVSFKR